MVSGMVRVIAQEFFNLTVQIELEEEIVEEGAALPYHYRLAIEMMGGRDGHAIGSMCICRCLHVFCLFLV